MIRQMELKDIKQIKEIDKKCFKINAERTTDSIRGYIEKNNNSSIVYEMDNRVVGYNFIHIWGSFAWFGPLGVAPEYQSKGIGKALISHTIKILKEEYNVSTIGLNTMPESPYNVGFYMGMGFTPLKLSLNLKKQIHESDHSIELPVSKKYKMREIDISDKVNYLTLKDNLKCLSNEIFENFDLTSELHLIKNEDFGTIFTLEVFEKIHGVVICYIKSTREGLQKILQIKLAVIDNNLDYRESIDAIIETCVKYAQSINYENITVDCNTNKTEICNYLISKHNFRIEKNQVMMLMGKDNPFESDSTILLTRFAG